MSDLVLRSSVVTQQAMWSLVEHVHVALERFGDEERGAETVEYAGIIVIIGAIIVVLNQIDIPGKVSSFVGKAIGEILH